MSSDAAHVAAEALSAYSDGEIDADEAARIAGHVASCAECARILEEVTQTRNLLLRLPRHTAPATFARRVEMRIRRRARGRFFHSRWQTTAPLLAAAIVLVILVTLYVFSRVALETPPNPPVRDGSGSAAGSGAGAPDAGPDPSK